ncbi:xaa-Pro aminopeptidase 1-like isoform X2 [Littorina saxatilis]|uniref:xaa-Pro aminopeptidase 1-like isoform X2 n=1 Tax=Littorina saxatilis TaxID=31220 RepID=UPI0038B66C06
MSKGSAPAEERWKRGKMRTATSYLAACCLVLAATLCACGPVEDENVGHRSKRAAPSVADRKACQPGDVQPARRVDTTQRLSDLRAAMVNQSLDAFIVLSDDAHGSEYPSPRDKRRGFISGFTGSAGYAAVTGTQAAMWTDGRYFLEADDALDCNWIFMRMGEKDVPTLIEWLVSVLDASNVVGADPFLVPNSKWLSYESALKKANITLKNVTANPVDIAWGADQPMPPMSNISALEYKYTGETWKQKVLDIRAAMISRRLFGAYVVTSLDEIAWLFNIRGSDIDYNPFFISYAIIEVYEQTNANRTRLYIYDKARRLTMNPNDSETRHKLHEHLNTGADGQCQTGEMFCVEVVDYVPEDVTKAVQAVVNDDVNNKVWVTHLCNYAIYGVIPEAQRVQERSMIALSKAQKNEVERKGMENAYNRDSAVLIEFLAKIEQDVKSGKRWTEVSAAMDLKNMRFAAALNRGLSFPSISGVGPNGAIIHYRPANDTDRPITTTETYLLDSGGQYLDGTTDVTRTMHYGQPSAYVMECYTRVLMGAIDLAVMVWPEGLYGRQIDMAARAPLWSVGLEYRHGTGHGIGAYLSVHEGPGRISLYHEPTVNDETLYAYMFFSDEPGYYEPGRFGIRLETVVMVEPTNTTHKFGDKQFLRFKPITLVPFEPNLIDYSLLSKRQIEWLSDYHKLTQETIKPLLTTTLAKDWLKARTNSFTDHSTSAAHNTPVTMAMLVMAIASALTFRKSPVCLT